MIPDNARAVVNLPAATPPWRKNQFHPPNLRRAVEVLPTTLSWHGQMLCRSSADLVTAQPSVVGIQCLLSARLVRFFIGWTAQQSRCVSAFGASSSSPVNIGLPLWSRWPVSVAVGSDELAAHGAVSRVRVEDLDKRVCRREATQRRSTMIWLTGYIKSSLTTSGSPDNPAMATAPRLAGVHHLKHSSERPRAFSALV
jgi:hypothetical protein